MNRWKSSLTCSYCSKILKNPIELPCKHTLCNEHLTEKNISKQNRIDCGECKQDFEVKTNEFKSKLLVKHLLAKFFYLSEEEITIKKQIEDSIRKFFQMYEEFYLNKTSLALDVHERT
jgi:hypothetical protein